MVLDKKSDLKQILLIDLKKNDPIVLHLDQAWQNWFGLVLRQNQEIQPV